MSGLVGGSISQIHSNTGPGTTADYRRHRGAGLPGWITLYTLRHTGASLLARQSVHPTIAADILGHDPALHLRTDAHLYPEDRARATSARDAPSTRRDGAGTLRTAAAASGGTSFLLITPFVLPQVGEVENVRVLPVLLGAFLAS